MKARPVVFLYLKVVTGFLSLRLVTVSGLLLLSLLFFSPSAVFSQAVVLEAVIRGVTGDVEVRFPDKIDWEACHGRHETA